MSVFWLDRPTFVTGATGLLGSWLALQLTEAGADVVCLVRDWVPQSELMRSGVIDRVKTVRGDVRDQHLLERILGEYEINTVFHLAAQAIVPIANRNLISTLDTNIRGTWALLEGCRRSPEVKQIVVASSDKAYGDVSRLPYTEDMPLNPMNPYDVSKACADMITASYAKCFNLPTAITRCGNFFGGGDLNWSRIVPGTIRHVLRNERPIIRSDGKSIRDYFYVGDAAAANLLVAERLEADGNLNGEAFNFSYEEPMSVLDISKLILDSMGSSLKPDVRNNAKGEIQHQYLDASKARSVLSWSPSFAFEDGMERTIQWYRDNL